VDSVTLNGVRMNVVASAESGVVSSETIFHFEQQGNLVSARYRGGKIIDGYLIGRLEGATLTFRFVQADTGDSLDSGQSTAILEQSETGKLRLIEHFKWATRDGSGVNIFEEFDGLDS